MSKVINLNVAVSDFIGHLSAALKTHKDNW